MSNVLHRTRDIFVEDTESPNSPDPLDRISRLREKTGIWWQMVDPPIPVWNLSIVGQYKGQKYLLWEQNAAGEDIIRIADVEEWNGHMKRMKETAAAYDAKKVEAERELAIVRENELFARRMVLVSGVGMATVLAIKGIMHLFAPSQKE